jgi:hypothetical protein
MPINHQKCKRYKDTWAASGSALYEALNDGDKAKAEAIYQECEAVAKKLSGAKVTKEYAPHQQRVVDEKAELDKKIEALSKFINSSPVFKSLPHDEQGRMEYQLLIMAEYSSILGERIAAF